MSDPHSILQVKDTWKNALRIAEQVIDDYQMSHSVGVPINYECMVETAVDYAKKEPVYSAALLMVIADRCKLVVGEFPGR
jgi:hypothetical protein